MQQRIQRARAHPVSMSAQFLHHPKANQGFFGGMMKNVEANEARQEFKFVHFFQQ
jgi:hypothetical protein